MRQFPDANRGTPLDIGQHRQTKKNRRRRRTNKKRIKSLENFLQQRTIDVGDKLYASFKEATKKLS
jgi:hypothetical protein